MTFDQEYELKYDRGLVTKISEANTIVKSVRSRL